MSAAGPTPAGAAPATRPRLLVIEHEGDTGLGRLHALMAEVVDVEVRQMHRGDPVPADARAEGYAGLVVLGGVAAAWEDDVAPWLPATRRLMATSVEQALPTFGICLGGQLLALACGGEVGRGQAGLEVGVVSLVTLPAAADDPLLGGVPATTGTGFRAAQWHQDAVLRLPPGATLLVTGERYPHQAYRLGERAWGVQYHPEVSRDDWSTWVQGGSGSLLDGGVAPESVADVVAAEDQHLEAVAAAHARAFAAVVTRYVEEQQETANVT